jgi:hypothetical protein
MTDQDDVKMYNDLVEFLKSHRQDLQLAATDAVLAVKDTNGMVKLIQHGVVTPLVRLCSQPGRIGVNALSALVKLSSQGTSASQCVDDLLQANALNRLIEISLSKREASEESLETWKRRVNFSMALMANITRTEEGAVELVGKTLPEEAVPTTKEQPAPQLPTRPTMELLLSRFLSRQFIERDAIDNEALDNMAELDSRHDDPYQHFAAVLMNATQLEVGQKFVLRIQHNKNETTSVLQAILPQLKSSNPIRRRGIAGTIKNCCLNPDFAWWLLHEVKIVKHLLYPLAGPEELDVDEKRGMDPDLWLQGPDKVREPDYWTRLMLVEAILLLCASGRKSRERLRLERTYVILKMADMVEENEQVSERIDECVQFLKRDEEGTAEGSSDRLVEEAFTKKRLALPVSSTAKQIGGNEDYDDVD